MSDLSRDLGKQLEEGIITKLTILRQQGLVPFWQKNEPTFRKRGPRGFLPTVASGADFAGIFCNGAQAWAIEAKSIGCDPRTGEIKEFTKEERIPDTQEAHLNAIANAGGLSLLVLQFRLQHAPWQLYAIPWQQVPWRKHRIRHFVRPEDLIAFRMPAHTMILDRFVVRHPSGEISIRLSV